MQNSLKKELHFSKIQKDERPMQRTYVFFPQDAQQALQSTGGRIVTHPFITLEEEGTGLWTARFPDGTAVDECFLWTPDRMVSHRYTLPDGIILVEPQMEGDPYRSLFVLTPQMQDAYGMSRKETLEGYPHITMKDRVKEILVPGQSRTKDDSIFVDGFGTGRLGFTPLFVLFTYHPDGMREIYLIDHDDMDNPAQRYAHLREVMPAPDTTQPQIRYGSLDSQLKNAYGIDWEHEIARGTIQSERHAQEEDA
jgi:hypothetical protein